MYPILFFSQACGLCFFTCQQFGSLYVTLTTIVLRKDRMTRDVRRHAVKIEQCGGPPSLLLCEVFDAGARPAQCLTAPQTKPRGDARFRITTSAEPVGGLASLLELFSFLPLEPTVAGRLPHRPIREHPFPEGLVDCSPAKSNPYRVATHVQPTSPTGCPCARRSLVAGTSYFSPRSSSHRSSRPEAMEQVSIHCW